ncbi:MAG: HAD family hydrolase [Chlorobiota bacterium]|nr:HAD family hydrolase [Chlorobiota bacterium]QQS67506.1 MAG: HAD family hydrolase [Chlorobiota bacterium]
MIKVVTIDFWDTLFSESGNGGLREEARMKAIYNVIENNNYKYDSVTVYSAYKHLWDYFDIQWLENQRTPNSYELCNVLFNKLNIEIPEPELFNLSQIFRKGILQHPPGILPNVKTGLEYLSSKYILVIISDTAFSGGIELRELMKSTGIYNHFSNFIFSDEVGSAKPNKLLFEKALEPFSVLPIEAIHIGDIERTDIVGANNFGMKSIIYKGGGKHKYAVAESNAHYILNNWNEIETIFNNL